MAGGFDVQILLRLVDKLTEPARKAGQSYQQMAQNISRSSQQIRAASASAAAGVGAIGSAAARANAQLNATAAGLRRVQTQAGRGGVIGADRGVFGAMGAWMGIRNVIMAGRDSALAENRFRALVDDVTPQGLKDIRAKLDARMMRSGETYAELLNAAGDAGQIIGSSKLAADIAVAASKLAKVDTAGKNVGDFAENLAAVLGPKGTMEELTKMSDILLMQQKLGAATAGGTIEAYKNVAGFKDIYRFDMADMLTSIGMIKNKAPALQDSQIGNMAKYGIRTLASPIKDMQKKLAAVGLSRETFMTDGAFDIAKTQEIFWRMNQSEKGRKAFQKLFAGKNVLAGQYWSMLATMDPAEFAKYRERMVGGEGALDEADEQYREGLPGALNAILGSIFKVSRAFGELLTPAISGLANIVAPLAGGFADLVTFMKTSAPVLTTVTSYWLGLTAALGALGLVSKTSAAAAGVLFRLPLLLAGPGLGVGLWQGMKTLPRLIALTYRFAGALGVAAMAFRALRNLTVAGLVVTGVYQIWKQWSDLVAIAKDPIHLKVLWPEMPEWLSKIVEGWSKDHAGYTEKRQAQQQQWNQSWAAFYERGGWAAWLGLTPERNPLLAKVGEELVNFAAPVRAPIRGVPLPERSHFRVPLPEPSHFRGVGVPEVIARNAAAGGAGKVPEGITIQADGPQVLVKQAPPNINITNNVTVNATTNASPEAIGAAAASAVGNKVRGALSDAPLGVP